MRRLTVSTLRRQSGSLYRVRYDIVPAIRLNGNWLALAGFTPGEKIRVHVEASALVIRKESAS